MSDAWLSSQRGRPDLVYRALGQKGAFFLLIQVCAQATEMWNQPQGMEVMGMGKR
jgi:hypothetical protein